ncbi:hypothetical protein JNA64_13850 [Pseudomonas stutzeri]|uniref:hypothetical protein n=1 Tax=Stutzerimonas stutzeri TaxID=316 RepID=UPI001F5187ED|nr:hypothetical protein [Stutzerimonas stutzeri]MCI0918251.1 hypothetical protein [Stutzerimonas stutzeri]
MELAEKKVLFRSRPFKTRNADEYDLSSILNLYVNPINGLTTPFDYENTIIKGRMGSGKTMYLRANQAYYLYGILPSLMDRSEEIVLPVFIRLSDFQHIKDPSEIYRGIIVKIIEELTSIYVHLQDQRKLTEMHTGVTFLTEEMFSAHKLAASMRQLAKLGCDEYIERVTTELNAKAGGKASFIELSASWKNSELSEIKKKPNPGIKDIESCYKNLLEGQEGKILLLIDEAGSLDRKFFQNDEGTGFFEILMNQFRTASFIRTKIAVYPNSYSDMLTETRYGSLIRLEESVNDERGYKRFRARALSIIENYINPHFHESFCYEAGDIFDLSGDEYGDCLEQLLYASQGNMRRLIQLLDLSLNSAYRDAPESLIVTKDHSFEALREHAEEIESIFGVTERAFLESIVGVCRARGAYKFKFPNMSPILYKYSVKSREYNLINIEELGAGRKGTVYSFDYAYAILKDLPTHYAEGSEKFNKERTLRAGKWINRVALISEELIEQAGLPGKIEGKIDYTHKDSGFIVGVDDEKYFFQDTYIVEADRGVRVNFGRKVRFYPAQVGDTKIATNIELLA